MEADDENVQNESENENENEDEPENLEEEEEVEDPDEDDDDDEEEQNDEPDDIEDIGEMVDELEDEEEEDPDEETEDKDMPIQTKSGLYVTQDSDTEDSITDSDVESEDEDNVDVKIDNEFKRQFIQSIHPEEMHDSFHEMNASCVIARDKEQFIVDTNHTTYPFLTKYEKARVLGVRITQLNKGAKPLIEYQSTIIDNHLIAERELQEKKIPFIVMRPLPNGRKEYWKLQDLEIIDR